MFISLKDKKGITVTNAFKKTLKESNSKPNKIWVGKGRQFYNRSMKSWLEKNAIEMYSTHNQGKLLLLKYSLEPWKKIYQYMTSVSKNVYIDKLDDIVNKYRNAYHNTIKMKPVDENQAHILTLVKKLVMKVLNLKLVILLEYQNIKIFLQKAAM